MTGTTSTPTQSPIKWVEVRRKPRKVEASNVTRKHGRKSPDAKPAKVDSRSRASSQENSPTTKEIPKVQTSEPVDWKSQLYNAIQSKLAAPIAVPSSVMQRFKRHHKSTSQSLFDSPLPAERNSFHSIVFSVPPNADRSSTQKLRIMKMCVSSQPDGQLQDIPKSSALWQFLKLLQQLTIIFGGGALFRLQTSDAVQSLLLCLPEAPLTNIVFMDSVQQFLQAVSVSSLQKDVESREKFDLSNEMEGKESFGMLARLVRKNLRSSIHAYAPEISPEQWIIYKL